MVTKHHIASCSLSSREMGRRILRIKLENSWLGIKTSKQITRRVKLNVSMFTIFCLFLNVKNHLIWVIILKKYFISVYFCIFFCLLLQSLSHAATRLLCIMHFATKYTCQFAFFLQSNSKSLPKVSMCKNRHWLLQCAWGQHKTPLVKLRIWCMKYHLLLSVIHILL